MFNNFIASCFAATVGVTQIIDHPALNTTCEGVIATLKQDKNTQILYENAQGNIAMAAQIAQQFVGAGVDAIVTISTPSTQAAISAVKGTTIPVFFASVTDPVGINLVKDPNQPEGYITGCSNFTSIDPQLELFKQIVPHLKVIGIIYNPSEINSVIMIEKIQIAGRAAGVDIVTAPVNGSNEISAATRQLVDQVDALFISNDNTALSAFSTIVKIATASNKPVFVSDIDLVKQGAVAALGPSQYHIGVITSNMVYKYLKFLNDLIANKQAVNSMTKQLAVKQLAVNYSTNLLLYLNQTQANKLNISFPEYLLQKADKIL